MVSKNIDMEKFSVRFIIYKFSASYKDILIGNEIIIGVKGRLETQNNSIVVVAEKVTFLSSKKENSD